jgi:hypothetical protein
MTEIDALLAEADALVVKGGDHESGIVRRMFTALTTERAKVAALDVEVKRLNKALTYEQHRFGRQGTHGPGCHEWGPEHYECLEAEAARWREVARELAGFLPKDRQP